MCHSLSNVLKKSDPPEIFKSFTLEKIDSYAPELAAYTDGSKSQSGLVSAAYCIPEINVSRGYRLSNNLSIYTAELQAIKLCLEFILSTVCKQACYDSRCVVIFTDSLSSAISLGAGKSNCRQGLINDIINIVMQITDRTVILVWIPGHSGIRGNDIADSKAKEALNCPTVQTELNAEEREVFESVDSYIIKKWQRAWDSSLTGNHNRTISPIVSCTSKYSNISRLKETIISRLRLGKCLLNAYLKVIGKHATGLCTTCGVSETIEHYLLHCTDSNLSTILLSECNRLLSGSENSSKL